MKGSLTILSFFVAGIFLALSDILPEGVTEMKISTYALMLLMFLVGVSTGMNTEAFEILKKLKARILLVPASAIIGTWIGVLAVSLFLPAINFYDSLAIGSGFGYYSLSSILIGKIRGEAMGVVALLSNIIREAATLLLTPVLVKYFGKISPIASGGATSMDTTLPVITRYSGAEYAIISVFSGTVLTIISPIFISLFLML